MPDAQIGVGGALIDAEQHLPGIHRIRQTVEPVMLRLAALQPPQCPLAGGFRVFVGSGILNAFVESHGNVAAQIGLDAHALLRPHKDAVSIQMRGEGHALLLDFSQAGKGKHLKAAAVR